MADPLRRLGAPLAFAALAIGLAGPVLAATSPAPRPSAAQPAATKKAASAPRPAQSAPAPQCVAKPSPAPATVTTETFWGFETAQIRFDCTHTDAQSTAWAVRSFVKTDSLDVAFAQLVSAPASHPHATVYCEPMIYGNDKGVLISVALLGKDPSRSEKLKPGDYVVVRILQRRARQFAPPRRYGGETQ